MSRAGPILAKIGGVFMIVGGSIFLAPFLFLFVLALFEGASLAPLGIEHLWITQVITIALGILALNAKRRVRKGSKSGVYMLLIVGVFAAIGSFIPIVPPQTLDIGLGQTLTLPVFTVNATFLFIDPYLIICAGIIELLEVKEPGELQKIEEKEEKEAKELTDKKKEKEEIKKEREQIKKERDALKRERQALKKERKDLRKETSTSAEN